MDKSKTLVREQQGFLFTRATSQSQCLHETLALLSASGACLATTETECRGRDNLRNSRSVFLIVGIFCDDITEKK